jgi:uncharacterized RDD family membrane protein YckC
MKCPKCGFNSFDHLDSCKKCGNDLMAFKAKHGLRSLLFPTAKSNSEQVVLPEAAETPEEALLTEATAPTDFGFGFMEEPEAITPPALPVAEDDGDAAADSTDRAEDFTLDDVGEGFELEASAEGELPPLEGGIEELPPLEDPDDFSFFDAAEEQEDMLGEDVELPSWDDLAEESPEKKPARRKETSDPFEQRESAAAGRVPEIFIGQTLGDEAAFSAATPTGDELRDLPSDEPAEAEVLATAIAESQRQNPETTVPLPPVEETSAEGHQEFPPPASLVGRLGALLADLLLVGSVLAVFLLLGQHLLEPQSAVFPDPVLLLRLAVPYFLLIFLGCFGYFTICHLLFGQTPGKMLFGLGVETLDGSPLSSAQAFLRSVGGLAGWCLGGLGYASVLFDAAGRGWNDRLAGTRVVAWEERPQAPAADGTPSAEEDAG